MASTERSNERPVIGSTRARQGRTGTHVFWVLVFGTLLAALALFAAWAWKANDLRSANSNNPQASSGAEQFNTPAQAPVQAPPATPAAPAAR